MSGWISRRSGDIAWLERPGAGPALVLLHGIGSNAGSFSPLLAHLEPHLRVVAWNAPGYLGSTPLAMSWPLAQDYADALAQFVDAIGLQRFALIGHSLGALMAAAYAADHRDRVAHMVLAAPALGHGMARGGVLSAAAQARIDELEKLGAPAFARLRAPRLVHEPQGHPQAVAFVRDGMAQVSMPGYAQAARMLAAGRLLDDAERLQVVTDVIVGACDQVTPPDGARRLHAALRPEARGRLLELPALGHAIYQQDPAGFARTIATLGVSAA